MSSTELSRKRGWRELVSLRHILQLEKKINNHSNELALFPFSSTLIDYNDEWGYDKRLDFLSLHWDTRERYGVCLSDLAVVVS